MNETETNSAGDRVAKGTLRVRASVSFRERGSVSLGQARIAIADRPQPIFQEKVTDGKGDYRNESRRQ